MSKSSKYKTSRFTFVGQLSKIKLKGSKIKYLKLVTSDSKYWIKVNKKVRKNLDSNLIVGCYVEIKGKQRQHLKTDKSEFKAQSVKIVVHPSEAKVTKVEHKQVAPTPTGDRSKKSTAKVLVCQKSKCWKRGGKEICQQLETAFSDRGFEDLIQIKKTGCLKKCKKAPNLVMMPDKIAYSQVKPKQIKDLVEKHLTVSL